MDIGKLENLKEKYIIGNISIQEKVLFEKLMDQMPDLKKEVAEDIGIKKSLRSIHQELLEEKLKNSWNKHTEIETGILPQNFWTKYKILFYIIFSIFILVVLYYALSSKHIPPKNPIYFTQLLEEYEATVVAQYVERSTTKDNTTILDSIKIGLKYNELKKFEDAKQMFKTLLSKQSDNDFFKLQLGIQEYRLGNNEKAKELWINIEDTSFHDLRNAVELLLMISEGENGDIKEANKIYNSLKKENNFIYKGLLID